MAFFKIDGVTIETPSECSWALMDISGKDSGRTTNDGKMHNTIIAKKRKLECKWPVLSWTECSNLAKKMKNKNTPLNLTYPDLLTGTMITKSFYTGDMRVEYFDWSRTLVRDITCNFIEV